ncbi:MAG: hypothetical protein Kow0092_03830 [Deferrisomatales bacterium]
MEPRDLLRAQVDTWVQEIARASRALETVGQVDPRLYERVRARFERLLGEQRAVAEEVRRDLDGGKGARACAEALWRARDRCAGVFREVLACAQGALARREGLDGGLCRIADALLDRLSRRADVPWGRFTVVAEGEFFYDMAEVIRLRFPEVSVWSLPVAAHEFGHFAATASAFRGAAEGVGGREQALLQEHFADGFATYALGPAFACTAVLQRLDPTRPFQETERHPSPSARVRCILRVLERLEEARGPGPAGYGEMLAVLRRQWRDAAAGGDPPEEFDPAAFDALADRLWEWFDARAPAARYDGWLRALRLAVALHPDEEAAPVGQEGDEIADVLNAAWLCRTARNHAGDPHAVRRIGRRALALCREIADDA